MSLKKLRGSLCLLRDKNNLPESCLKTFRSTMTAKKIQNKFSACKRAAENQPKSGSIILFFSISGKKTQTHLFEFPSLAEVTVLEIKFSCGYLYK